MARYCLAAVVTLGAVLGAWSTAQAGCTVFQHRDFGGSSWALEDGEDLQMGGEQCGRSSSHGRAPQIYYEPSWNDQVSSFIADGCTITLWQHVSGCGGGGARFVRTNKKVNYIGDSWNDQASWVECHC